MVDEDGEVFGGEPQADPTPAIDLESPSTQPRWGRRLLGLVLVASVVLGAAGAVRSAIIGDDARGPCYIVKSSGSVADARQSCDSVPRAEQFAEFEFELPDRNVPVETISQINESVQAECRNRLPTLGPEVVTDELQVRANLDPTGLRFTQRCFAIVRD